MPTPAEEQARRFSKVIDFWRGQATENLKRALRAEAQLAQYEGPIG